MWKIKGEVLFRMMFLMVLCASVITMLAVSWKLSNKVVTPKICDPNNCYKDVIERGEFNQNEYESLIKEDFILRTSRGYNLSCTFISRKTNMPPTDGRERVVVIVHGYSYCRVGSIKYALMFHEIGFNCVLYDHCNHGISDKAPTSMGFFEAYDLKCLCDWTRERLGHNAVVGTHGESMGGATVMMNASIDDKLAFVIEDCGYSSLPDQLAHSLKVEYKLPRYPFLPIASLLCKLRGGVWFKDVIPKDAVAKCKDIPMLFIHGGTDDYVPVYMVDELYKAKSGTKMKTIFPNASHAESFMSDKEGYKNAVKNFLEQNEII